MSSRLLGILLSILMFSCKTASVYQGHYWHKDMDANETVVSTSLLDGDIMAGWAIYEDPMNLNEHGLHCGMMVFAGPNVAWDNANATLGVGYYHDSSRSPRMDALQIRGQVNYWFPITSSWRFEIGISSLGAETFGILGGITYY